MEIDHPYDGVGLKEALPHATVYAARKKRVVGNHAEHADARHRKQMLRKSDELDVIVRKWLYVPFVMDGILVRFDYSLDESSLVRGSS